MSSHSSRSPPRPGRSGGGLDNFRVLEQCRPDPTDTPPLPQSSRTFRVTAFVFHMGMSMLESRRGHAALINLISESWRASDRRAKKTFIPKKTCRQNRKKLVDSLTGFLLSVALIPPTSLSVIESLVKVWHKERIGPKFWGQPSAIIMLNGQRYFVSTKQ